MKVEVHFVLYGLNNTYIPTTFVKAREDNSDEEAETENFAESPYEKNQNSIRKSKLETSVNIDPDANESVIISAFIATFMQELNKEEESIDGKELENDTQIAVNESSKINTSSTECNVLNENPVINLDNNSVIFYQNTSILVEVSEKQTNTSAVCNITEECILRNDSVCCEGDNVNNTNITADYLSGK